MSYKVVIPARYASTRLPGKPLADIGGKPMVQWVVEAACRSAADEVLVATDDERIAAAVSHPRAGDPQMSASKLAVMTRADHASGTDRIAEVAAMRGWQDDVIVVNVQGDEPHLPPALIDQVAELLANDATADMATLCTPISSLREFMDPNVVKIVFTCTAAPLALYFSRAPVPWTRDGAPDGLASQRAFAGAHRHLGIYAYRVKALRSLTQLPPSTLELAEKLEQLRALQAGMRIAVAVANKIPGEGVDTFEDLDRVRAKSNRPMD